MDAFGTFGTAGTSLKPKAEPRKHQVKAIEDVEKGLTENEDINTQMKEK